VLHDADNTPVHVQYVGGSVNPDNPGYLAFTYDRAEVSSIPPTYSYLVTGATSYWVDLVEANKLNNTQEQWATLRVNYTSDFGLSDLSPASWEQLADAYFQTNSTQYVLYETLKAKGTSDPTNLPDTPLQVYCETTTDDKTQEKACLNAMEGLSDEEAEAVIKRESARC